MKKVNVFMIGEIDSIFVDYHVEQLNALYDPTLNCAEISATIGSLLDRPNGNDTLEDERPRAAALLGLYVANLGAYQVARQAGLDNIFITSFRSNKPKKKGYLTRIAGICSLQNDAEGFESNDPEKAFGNFLSVFKSNPLYSRDRYDSDSYYHELVTKLGQIPA